MKNIGNLIYKELKLVVSPAAYLFPLLAALLLIPQYPYCVGMLYFFFGIQISFQMAFANKDNEFTAMLPIPRRQVVVSKYITVILIQFLQILIAIPFAVLTSFVVNPSGNPLGMDANTAFFGLTLIEYSAFNAIFLPGYFKTGYKMGIPFVLGLTAFFITALAIELIIAFVPALKSALDGIGGDYFVCHLLTLLLGIAVYIITLALSYKKSVKNFEKVNL